VALAVWVVSLAVLLNVLIQRQESKCKVKQVALWLLKQAQVEAAWLNQAQVGVALAVWVAEANNRKHQ
jgi:hypothetical protein